MLAKYRNLKDKFVKKVPSGGISHNLVTENVHFRFFHSGKTKERRVARWYIFKLKIQFRYAFEGLGIKYFGIFYQRLVF
jgi:hypothetical protein